ncbi:MAG: uroporphyrinogen decarboxylase family protein, partial [Anaerolineales bacterium]
FPYLEDVAACGGNVIGVDFRMPLGAAWQKIGSKRAIQGNLDPMTLLAPWSELQYHIDRVLEEADGRPGHIFNLGHGLHKTTPVDNVQRLVDHVHEKTTA